MSKVSNKFDFLDYFFLIFASIHFFYMAEQIFKFLDTNAEHTVSIKSKETIYHESSIRWVLHDLGYTPTFLVLLSFYKQRACVVNSRMNLFHFHRKNQLF